MVFNTPFVWSLDTTTVHKEIEQFGDRRNAGENSPTFDVDNDDDHHAFLFYIYDTSQQMHYSDGLLIS
jgi:hypothetical protein